MSKLSGPKILMTGGHLTPALATIEKLKSRSRLLFVGRSYSDSDHSASREHQLIRQAGIDFRTFNPPKFHRKPLSLNFVEALRYPGALVKAATIVRAFSPDIVLSFGGYLAPPIALAAYFQDIPVITHEQTTTLGLGNQLITLFATKLALSWPTPVHRSNAILTGNPVRSAFLGKPTKPAWYRSPDSLPTIYITGGNLGSRDIIAAVAAHLNTLAAKYYLVIQTGAGNHGANQQTIAAAARQLDPHRQRHVHAAPWFTAAETSYLMHTADLVVGRSGANTATELLITKASSILIPLPFSGRAEQLGNALLLQRLGLAVHLPQTNLDLLPQLIDRQLSSRPPPASSRLTSLIKLHTQAASNLADLTLSCAAAKNLH